MSDSGLQDSVNAQLERMLSRPPLASSPSLTRLLRYLVQETLAGRGAEIKEYTLGVRIFNRNADFNPRVDPIVRVQTHYLRAKLAQYYAGAGAQDPMTIELPARTYIPRIPQPEFVAVPETPAPPPDGEPHRNSRSAVAVGTVVVALAGFLFLGNSWRGRAANHDPDAIAQDLYSRGRYLLDRQTETALHRSADCFRQATAQILASPPLGPAWPMRSTTWCSTATCLRAMGWKKRGGRQSGRCPSIPTWPRAMSRWPPLPRPTIGISRKPRANIGAPSS